MSEQLPRKALSVRQPWAYCLAVGWKRVENRTWKRDNPAIHYRGEFAIHASKGMTRDEYEGCAELCEDLGYKLPAPADLERGGIVGVARITTIIGRSYGDRLVEEDWQKVKPFFFGPIGLVIADARQVPFIPAVGMLGFFDWKPADPGIVPPPAKWMLPKPEKSVQQPLPLDDRQGSLF